MNKEVYNCFRLSAMPKYEVNDRQITPLALKSRLGHAVRLTVCLVMAARDDVVTHGQQRGQKALLAT